MADDEIEFNTRIWKLKVSEETGHVDHAEVNEWLSADELGFKPTPQQEMFRTLAYKMARRKRYFRGEWFEASGGDKYNGHRVNERIWNRWCESEKRFKDWFYEEFPYTEEIGEEEFKMMDSQYWSGVRDAMVEGDEWAYRQYAKTRFDSAAAKKDQAESEALVELRGYFAAGGGEAWSSKPGEA